MSADGIENSFRHQTFIIFLISSTIDINQIKLDREEPKDAPPAEASQSPGPDGAQTNDSLSAFVNRMKISDEPRARLRSWLNEVFKIVITDERIIVGYFVCTDRDGNVILENSYEYTQTIEDNNEPRKLGLALVPGKHIVSVAVIKH